MAKSALAGLMEAGSEVVATRSDTIAFSERVSLSWLRRRWTVEDEGKEGFGEKER